MLEISIERQPDGSIVWHSEQGLFLAACSAESTFADAWREAVNAIPLTPSKTPNPYSVGTTEAIGWNIGYNDFFACQNKLSLSEAVYSKAFIEGNIAAYCDSHCEAWSFSDRPGELRPFYFAKYPNLATA